MTMPGMKMIRDGSDHNVFHEFYCYNCQLLVSPQEADNLAGNWICRRFREAATHRFGCIFFTFFSKGCLWIIVDSKNYLAFCLVHFLCIFGRNSRNSSDFRGINCPNKAGWWWGSTPVWKKSKNSSESAGSGFLYFQETNCPEIRFCHEKIR